MTDAGPTDPMSGSLSVLVPELYEQLREIAHRRLMSVRPGSGRDATLQTTALVHEAYMKLAGTERDRWNDEPHFLATAAMAMRQILIDRARTHSALKRGGSRIAVTLDEEAIAVADDPSLLLDIDEALTQLAATAPRLAKVVECRFYGAMSEEEIATALGCTVRTVQRDWAKARMLLRRALAPG